MTFMLLVLLRNELSAKMEYSYYGYYFNGSFKEKEGDQEAKAAIEFHAFDKKMLLVESKYDKKLGRNIEIYSKLDDGVYHLETYLGTDLKVKIRNGRAIMFEVFSANFPEKQVETPHCQIAKFIHKYVDMYQHTSARKVYNILGSGRDSYKLFLTVIPYKGTKYAVSQDLEGNVGLLEEKTRYKKIDDKTLKYINSEETHDYDVFQVQECILE